MQIVNQFWIWKRW